MTEFDDALGRLLRRLREGAGMSQRALADVLREDQAVISRLESGNRHVSVETLLQYLSGIGLTLTEVAGEISRLPSADQRPSLWQKMDPDTSANKVRKKGRQ